MSYFVSLGKDEFNLSWLEAARAKSEPGELRDIFDFLLDYLAPSPTLGVRTSGTTGTPKQIVLQKEHMRNSARMTGQYFGLETGMKALLCLPVQYIAGKMMLVRAIELGLQIDLVPPGLNPLCELADPIYDFTAMVPAQVEQSIMEPTERSRFQGCRKVIIGGGAVSPLLRRRLQPLRNACFATYGMTETITHIAIQNLNGEQPREDFEALPGVKIWQDKQERLTIDAPHLSPEKLVTNDVVELTDFNRFRWRGRIDNVINSGGIKIIPEEVEKKLASTLDRRFFISSRPHPQFGEEVILVVEGIPMDEITRQLFVDFLQNSLEKYEKPKEVIYINAFLETASGKVKRKASLKLI